MLSATVSLSSVLSRLIPESCRESWHPFCLCFRKVTCGALQIEARVTVRESSWLICWLGGRLSLLPQRQPNAQDEDDNWDGEQCGNC